MTKNSFNPYLPSCEYIPDAEPHIVGDRVYIYGSHDLFNAMSFCMGDYVCWSAPLDNLADWRYEGVIFKREQEPNARGPRVFLGLAAPDMVQGADGRFYLYYFMGGTGKISVAVCDTPAGKYEFYGHVSYSDGVPIGEKGEPFQFDPGVFMDDDGRLYLYTGFALRDNPLILMGRKPTDYGPMCFELDTADMLTVKEGPVYIGVGGYRDGNDKGYENHLFLEASSMRKFDGRYYFIYSSLQSHELCYAVSDRPTGGFSFGGVLVSNGDIGTDGIKAVHNARNCTGNTHGSLIELNGKHYVFYHRQTNRKQSSRQACAEEIRFENGRFYQAKMTSQSFTDGALKGRGRYPSYIACNLYGKSGTRFLSMIKHRKGSAPYITQDGKDVDAGDSAGGSELFSKTTQYIANFCDGAVAGFKYFDLSGETGPKSISAKVLGNAEGELLIYAVKKESDIRLFDASIASISSDASNSAAGDAVKLCSIRISKCGEKRTFRAETENTHALSSAEALYFTFNGKGRFNFYSFTLE